MTNNYIQLLEKVLADSYALFLKTQNYHWNVEAKNFRDLHLLFEEQYNELFPAIDKLAELIRCLGAKTIGSFEDFSKITSIKSGNKDFTSEQMVKDLCEDQEIIEESIHQALSEAKKIEDEVLCSFLCDRLSAHRKNKWMLKSAM